MFIIVISVVTKQYKQSYPLNASECLNIAGHTILESLKIMHKKMLIYYVNRMLRNKEHCYSMRACLKYMYRKMIGWYTKMLT